MKLREIAIAFAAAFGCLVAPPIALILFPWAVLASILMAILPPSALRQISACLRRIWGDVDGAIYDPDLTSKPETAATTIKDAGIVVGSPVAVEGISAGLKKFLEDNHFSLVSRQIAVSVWYLLALFLLWYLVQRHRPAKERISVVPNPPKEPPRYSYSADERTCLRIGFILSLAIAGVYVHSHLNQTLADRIFSWANSEELTEFQPKLRPLPDQRFGETTFACWAFDFDPTQFREPANLEVRLRALPDAIKYKLGSMDAQIDDRLLEGVTYLSADEPTQRRLAFVEKKSHIKCAIIFRIAPRKPDPKLLAEVKVDPRKFVTFKESPRRLVSANEKP